MNAVVYLTRVAGMSVVGLDRPAVAVKSGLFEDPPELTALEHLASGLERRLGDNSLLTETFIPMQGWYFGFTIDARTTFPSLSEEEIAAFNARRKIYIGYLINVSSRIASITFSAAALSKPNLLFLGLASISRALGPSSRTSGSELDDSTVARHGNCLTTNGNE
jgi:hypothetical protein